MASVSTTVIELLMESRWGDLSCYFQKMICDICYKEENRKICTWNYFTQQYCAYDLQLNAGAFSVECWPKYSNGIESKWFVTI